MIFIYYKYFTSFAVSPPTYSSSPFQFYSSVVPQQGSQATVEHLDEKIPPKASFSPPLCTLKSISYEVITQHN